MTEWGSLPKELRAVVRSTLPEATAEAPAVMRTLEQGGMRKPVTGEGRTGEAQAADTLGQMSGGGKRSAQGAPATEGARDTRPKRRDGAAGLKG